MIDNQLFNYTTQYQWPNTVLTEYHNKIQMVGIVMVNGKPHANFYFKISVQSNTIGNLRI